LTASIIFCSFGNFFKNADEDSMGVVHSRFVFHVWYSSVSFLEFPLAYCTTSTTLISGAMAERCKFVSYLIFIPVATAIYCVPAAWLWNPEGWLTKMGAVDIGGSSVVEFSISFRVVFERDNPIGTHKTRGRERVFPNFAQIMPRVDGATQGVVHLVGANTGLIASILLGPRLGRFDVGFAEVPLGNPTNVLLGMFMLWWGWLGFSASSTGGLVHDKWKYSASFVLKKGLHDVSWLLNSVMGSLVAISGGAPIVHPWQALVIGAVVSGLVLIFIPVIRWLKIDDPTENFVTHGICGIWGLITIGLLPDADSLMNYTRGWA
ncbi:putative ammonium transporter 3-like, partial [Tropilaelaps mercedesae]